MSSFTTQLEPFIDGFKIIFLPIKVTLFSQIHIMIFFMGIHYWVDTRIMPRIARILKPYHNPSMKISLRFMATEFCEYSHHFVNTLFCLPAIINNKDRRNLELGYALARLATINEFARENYEFIVNFKIMTNSELIRDLFHHSIGWGSVLMNLYYPNEYYYHLIVFSLSLIFIPGFTGLYGHTLNIQKNHELRRLRNIFIFRFLFNLFTRLIWFSWITMNLFLVFSEDQNLVYGIIAAVIAVVFTKFNLNHIIIPQYKRMKKYSQNLKRKLY